MDKLEQFVQQEREQFDAAVPSLDVWKGIEGQLHAPKVRQLRPWRTVRLAAAMLFLLVAGGLIGRMLTNGLDTNSATLAAIDLEEIAPELVETEQYYAGEIDRKLQVLASYEQSATVVADVEELDTFLTELKSELLNAPQGSRDEIIGNIIRSYQAKLEILSYVLEQIQEPSNQNLGEDEISI